MGGNVVENAFDILKKTFKELLLKNNLHIIFLLAVVTCCMLYNFILDRWDVNVLVET
jgi:IS4 transposase